MRCGNRANRAQRYKVGDKWQTAEHCMRDRCDESDRCPCRCAGCLGAERYGCANEAEPTLEAIPSAAKDAAPGALFRPLGLCAECKAEYAALAPKPRKHTAMLDSADAVSGLCALHGMRAGECGACVL